LRFRRFPAAFSEKGGVPPDARYTENAAAQPASPEIAKRILRALGASELAGFGAFGHPPREVAADRLVLFLSSHPLKKYTRFQGILT
jgi:hypothetical protein